MSVIVTGMDMPECCHFCNHEGCINNGIYWADETTDFRNGTHKNCPLKSIDGLIETIIERGDLYTIGGRANGKSVKLGMGMAIEIIKEYCGVSE